tara:strand:+ start:1221 stop:2078 length:858 start_codon:yes stop_codon:yes gene_type:complete
MDTDSSINLSTPVSLMSEWLANGIGRIGSYRFVPLVSEQLNVDCALHFHILRPSHSPGHIPDIDNQIKVLLDALKMPQVSEIGSKFEHPDHEEDPFFVLLGDDGLVSKVTSVSDELLMPVESNPQIRPKDTRIFIQVFLRPIVPLMENQIFYSGAHEIWEHKLSTPTPLATLNDVALKAEATQCVYRIKALAETRRMESDLPWPPEDFQNYTEQLLERSKYWAVAWQNELRPVARSIKQELLKRIYGAPPYPRDHDSVAIDHGMLAGVSPLYDAATELRTLIQML